MKKKITLACLMIVFFLSGLNLAGTTPIPPEVKSYLLKFMNEMGKINSAFADSIEKINGPEEMALALDAYTDSVKPLVEGMVALQEKYSDFFRNMDKEDDEKVMEDADLEKARDVFEENAGKFSSSMLKIMSFLENPKVVAALERLQGLMNRLSPEENDED